MLANEMRQSRCSKTLSPFILDKAWMRIPGIFSNLPAPALPPTDRFYFVDALCFPRICTGVTQAQHMQSDDIVWQIINTNFCSYKIKYARCAVAHLLERMRRRIAETKTTLPACAIGSRAPSQTPSTQRCAKSKVQCRVSDVYSARRVLPVREDGRASTHAG